ncbi:putative retrotransposon Copia-like protein [Arabidopsis thaliana]|uniref:Retrotransposon Copia-like N-terminal domain-containing protein n=2 Tax=Arabidopsis TaxID=3701 RepID=A0A178WCA5_ARATH|nr:Retrotransposon Copia-like N-terminal [Arabidopsis thaliana x Arabidopsis arenosa]OAP16079.1 hypothetical protein AXX17_AT1G22300 [Arabidopsis thaliana]
MAETIKSVSPLSDPDSPYYLPPDINQTSDFSIEKLSEAEDNYVIWKFRFRSFLELTNKIGFIDSTLPQPEPSSPLYHPWKRCDTIVKYWLMNLMSEELVKSVMYAKTAHQAWENLRLRFVPCVDLKIYQLRRRLATLRQGGDSVEEYFGKLSKVWMELSEYAPVPECKCGGCNCESTKLAKEAREKEQRYEFLMGLNKEFEVVRITIMLKKPPPPLYEAYDMVQGAELTMKRYRR